jgi:glycosyltransferase involved in cell wall biosynthesis
MRIGIVSQPPSGWMGGTIYIQNLIKIIGMFAPEVETCVIVNSAQNAQLHPDIQPFVKEVIVADCLSDKLRNRIQWRLGREIAFFKDRKFSELVAQKQLDFIYPVSANMGIAWNFKCGWAGWIPDFQHKYLTHLFSKDEIDRRDRMYAYMAKQMPHIVFSSKMAQDDFYKFYPHSPAQTHILSFRTLPALDWFTADPVQVQAKYQLPDRFFLVSNQFWIHKNHKIIIAALSMLKERGINPIVACTGELYDSRFPKYGEEIAHLVKEKGLEQQFRILGLIPRQDQIQLMRRSLAVIQPSLFEGWSTVVEDARVLGKILIISDFAVHLEQNPPEAIFFAKDSAEDLSQKLEQAWQKLESGVNFEAEAEAQITNHSQYQTYSQDFFKIVAATQAAT